MRLLDVSVLVPLLWPQHLHHTSAQGWFATVRDGGWATCPLTELGCVRVLAAPSVSQGALTVKGVADQLKEILTESHHAFWPDDLQLSDGRFDATLPHFQSPSQLTDRYLLALAAAHGGVLATFDRSVGAGLPADSALLPHLEIVGT